MTKMTYPEMVAFITRLERVLLPSGTSVKRFGDVDSDMYFVVSGALRQTTYLPLEEGEDVHRKSSIDLVENDFFGDVYPFELEEVSPSQVDTITDVELVKISKSRLMTVCNKYPNIESLVGALYEARAKFEDEKASLKTVREAPRHQVPTKVSMKIYDDEAGKAPVVAEGFAEDISLGGALVVLGSTYLLGPSTDVAGRNVEIQMSLPSATVGLSIMGKIVWSKGLSHEGKINRAVGIQFTNMADTDRELLEQYCCGSEGEQNMLWGLWESLVNK